jgi:hypothetical protein
MIRLLLFIFLGLTVFLIVIHIQKIDYYKNPSKEITEDIYLGKTAISVHLSKYEQDDYVFNLSFNHIQSDILVNDINVQLEKVNELKSTSLDLIKILPYSGMHPWDIPEYKSFSEIPTNLRKLDTESNPYFAYDFIFEQNAKIETKEFLVRINLNISEDGNEKQITKELNIQKISKIELKPLDAHSDISFLLIPVTGVLTIIFALIWIINRRKKKTNA